MGTKWVPKLRTRAVIIVIELSLPILPQKYIRGILVEGRCLLDSTGDYVRGAGVTGIQTLTTEDVETLRPGGMKIQCFFFFNSWMSGGREGFKISFEVFDISKPQ